MEIGGVSSTSLRSYNTELVSKLINLVSAACQVLEKVFLSFDSLFKGFFLWICQGGTLFFNTASSAGVRNSKLGTVLNVCVL